MFLISWGTQMHMTDMYVHALMHMTNQEYEPDHIGRITGNSLWSFGG